MPKVEVNLPAPDFETMDYRGVRFHLADDIGRSRVLLVFNRGFV